MALPDAPSRKGSITDPAEANWIITLIRFGRPHTLIATTFQSLGIFILAAGPHVTAVKPSIFLVAWVASMLANLFVVGLNQLTDVPIDRLNKPSLPLAAGTLAKSTARWIIAAAFFGSLILALTQGVYLLGTVALVMLIGALYSLRPVRLKGRPVLAALSIALARGLTANLGLYLHYRSMIWPSGLNPPEMVVWPFLFFFGFGLIIAIFKDIPDRDGDRQFKVATFAVEWGRRRVFNIGRLLLIGLYGLPLAAGLALLPSLAGVFLLVTHLAILLFFLAKSGRTDPTRQLPLMRLYLTLWGLFYIEFILLAVYSLGEGIGGWS